MNNAARRAKPTACRRQCAGGSDRPGSAHPSASPLVAADFRVVAAPEFSPLFWRTTNLTHRELGSKHGPGLAGVRAHRFKDAAGHSDRGGLGPDVVLLDVGRLDCRSP